MQFERYLPPLDFLESSQQILRPVVGADDLPEDIFGDDTFDRKDVLNTLPDVGHALFQLRTVEENDETVVYHYFGNKVDYLITVDKSTQTILLIFSCCSEGRHSLIYSKFVSPGLSLTNIPPFLLSPGEDFDTMFIWMRKLSKPVEYGLRVHRIKEMNKRVLFFENIIYRVLVGFETEMTNDLVEVPPSPLRNFCLDAGMKNIFISKYGILYPTMTLRFSHFTPVFKMIDTVSTHLTRSTVNIPSIIGRGRTQRMIYGDPSAPVFDMSISSDGSVRIAVSSPNFATPTHLIGWKAVSGSNIVELRIPLTDKIDTGDGMKFRCGRAHVVNITTIGLGTPCVMCPESDRKTARFRCPDGKMVCSVHTEPGARLRAPIIGLPVSAASLASSTFIYQKGSEVFEPKFGIERTSCGHGIHFFLTADEAIEYYSMSSKIVDGPVLNFFERGWNGDAPVESAEPPPGAGSGSTEASPGAGSGSTEVPVSSGSGASAEGASTEDVRRVLGLPTEGVRRRANPLNAPSETETGDAAEPSEVDPILPTSSSPPRTGLLARLRKWFI